MEALEYSYDWLYLTNSEKLFTRLSQNKGMHYEPLSDLLLNISEKPWLVTHPVKHHRNGQKLLEASHATMFYHVAQIMNAHIPSVANRVLGLI